MAGFRVVVAGLEVGEMADKLLEVEPVVVAFDVEHAIHDEVTHGVHVDLWGVHKGWVKAYYLYSA